MTYEREYLPDRKQEEELEDVVRVLKGGASEALDVPDDDAQPTEEEGAPTGATRGEARQRRGAGNEWASSGRPEPALTEPQRDTAYRSPVAATAEPGQPTEEDDQC